MEKCIRQQPYAPPVNECDLIMKGGIASGVVYGSAVARIANDYRFRSVAGTSAGAIAAVVTAAAEYRRQTIRASGGENEAIGFETVVSLTQSLATGIEDLFQAKPRYQTLLKALIATTKAGEGAGFLPKFTRFLGAFVGIWEIALFAILFLFSAFAFRNGYTVGGALLLPAALIGPLVLAFIRFAHLMLTLKRDDFGMCTGLGAPGKPGVTDWIHNAVQTVAAKPKNQPLTVGDLWGDKPKNGENRSPGVVLVTMTTDLTSGRPYRTPLGGESHYFTEGEMADLFPPEIVEHLKRCGREVGTIRAPKNLRAAAAFTKGSALWRMPEAKDFPVVLSARLSLSFPALFSVVPLWREDRQLTRRPEVSDAETLVVDTGEPGAEPLVLRRCLLSDGGISSNFPVHFFDSFLPRRPTFGIKLGGWSPDHDGEAEEPDVVSCAEAGTSGGCACDQTTRAALSKRIAMYDIEGDQHRRNGAPAHDDMRTWPIGGTLGFIMRIIDTAKDWRDNLQSRLPGNAERIVEIRLTGGEGGYNLAMTPPTLERMNAIGALAGETLVESFADKNYRRFDEHRYLRALSFLKEFSERLTPVQNALGQPAGIDGLQSYPDLLKSYSNSNSNFSNGLEWRLAVEDFAQKIAALNNEAPDLSDQKTPQQFAALRVSAEAQIAEWPPRSEPPGEEANTPSA